MHRRLTIACESLALRRMPAAALDTFLAAADAFPTGVEISWSEGAIAAAEARSRSTACCCWASFTVWPRTR